MLHGKRRSSSWKCHAGQYFLMTSRGIGMVKGPRKGVQVVKGRMNARSGEVSWVGNNSRNLAHLKGRIYLKFRGCWGRSISLSAIHVHLVLRQPERPDLTISN